MGQLLTTTSHNCKLCLFNTHTGGEAVRVSESQGGIKGTRVFWMGDHDCIATTGFSWMSDQQVGMWEIGVLNNVKTITLDQC
jgi:coronin-1B/1C/6